MWLKEYGSWIYMDGKWKIYSLEDFRGKRFLNDDKYPWQTEISLWINAKHIITLIVSSNGWVKVPTGQLSGPGPTSRFKPETDLIELAMQLWENHSSRPYDHAWSYYGDELH